MRTYWLSSQKMTVTVEVDANGRITKTPPIVARFKGQPIANLIRWMGKQPSFFVQEQRGEG
jgi:hypothetical protein